MTAFDVTWPWRVGDLRPGLTAVLRVRNEARNLPWVLPPVLRAVDAVVLVDNESDDGTADVAQRVAEESGLGDRLTVTEYPFAVSRCGAEHLGTPPDSVHSLTHYYNWSFSQVQTRYSMKWDGDMVMTSEGEVIFSELAWQLGDAETVVRVQHQPLFVESNRVAYLDCGIKPVEPWIYPMGPDYAYVKGFDWEIRDFPEDADLVTLRRGLCVELKWLDSDEFAHWTDDDSLIAAQASRKRREMEVFAACREGRWDTVDGLVRIEAPEGEHIVRYVTRDWISPGSID